MVSLLDSNPQSFRSAQEYLAMERDAETKHEHGAGEIRAMAGASRRHVRFTLNIAGLLDDAFADGPCEVYSSDMRVQTAGAFFYPDVVAVCGEQRFAGDEQDTLTNPAVLFEVLSPNTEAYDRGRKFEYYRQIESLTDYVLVDQDACHVECYSRQEAGGWLLRFLTEQSATLELQAISCRLPLSQIYRRANLFAPADPE